MVCHKLIQNLFYKYEGHSTVSLFCLFFIILNFAGDTSCSI